MEAPIYHKLWAKTHSKDAQRFHPLWRHLLDVGAVAQALGPRFGGVAPLPESWLYFLVALHDIGKADPLFQIKAPKLAQSLKDAGAYFPLDAATETKGFRHEARSAVWLRSYLAERGWERTAIDVIVAAIKGHHGDFNPLEPPDEDELVWQAQSWNPLREEIADLVAQTLGVTDWAIDRFDDASRVGMRLSGLIVLADWIASNEGVYRYDDPAFLPETDDPAQYFAAAQKEARYALKRLELDADAAEFPAKTIAFTGLFPFTPRGAQKKVEELCLAAQLPPGLALIEAPMGEGKTEAALYVMQEWNRLRGRRGAYIALPTQATSNQMHRRYRQFLQDAPANGSLPHLVHGMAWLFDDIAPSKLPETFGDAEEPERARQWFGNAKRALLAPEGVGTIDQALMAALNVKHGFLRFFGLSAKVLVVDEVHACDAYMGVLLHRVLMWCRALSIPVILLSATLSKEQKRGLLNAYGATSYPEITSEIPGEEPYPLLTFLPLGETTPRAVAVPRDPTRNITLMLKAHPGLLNKAEEVARLAANSVRDGGCACVLVNTVQMAQDVYGALKTHAPAETELFLFHARFRAGVRDDIEKKRIMARFGKEATRENHERPERAIVVATQVVEQSLDVDFDVMLTQIAPIDLILQRSGRLWRHERGPRPTGDTATLHLLLPEDGAFDGATFGFDGTGRVYAPELLLRTYALVRNRPSINLPNDFRPHIEACYGDSPLPENAIPPERFDEAAKRRADERAHAESEAHKHLVADPSPRVFRYAEGRPPVEESEDARASYFRAQTRLGDETRSALVLTEPKLIAWFQKALAKSRDDPKYFPPKFLLRKLFLQKVGLPAYWLIGLKEAEGAAPILWENDGPRWLRRHLVLVMPGGQWRGIRTDAKGVRPPVTVTIADDPELGLLRSTETNQREETEDVSV